MPIFVPTLPQGQGPLQPIRAPQVQSKLPSPLRLDIPASIIQRERALGQADVRNQIALDQLDLQKHKLNFEIQNKVLENFNDDFITQYGQSLKQRQDASQGSFQVDPTIFSGVISEGNQILQEGQERLFKLTQNLGKDASSTAEFVTEAQRIKSDINNKIRSNTRLSEAMRTQRFIHGLEDTIHKEVARNPKRFIVNQRAKLLLDNKIRTNFEKGVPTFGEAFNPDNFVFDRKNGTDELEAAVDEALLDSKFVDIITNELDSSIPVGMVLKENVTVQRAKQDIIDKAKAILIHRPDFMGIADNLSLKFTNGDALAAAEHLLIAPMVDALALGEQSRRISESGTLSRLPEEALTDTTGEDVARGSNLSSDDRSDLNLGIDRLKREGFDAGNFSDADLIQIGKAKTESLDFKKDGSIDLIENKVVVGNIKPPLDPELQKSIDESEFDAEEFTNEGLKKLSNINVSLKEGVTLDGLADNALDVLRNLPEEFNNPTVKLTDTFRTEEQNKDANGVDNSFHKSGQALDFRTKDKGGKEFAEWVTQTEEGAKWLGERGYKAIWEDVGGENEHLHLEPVARNTEPVNDLKSRLRNSKWSQHIN